MLDRLMDQLLELEPDARLRKLAELERRAPRLTRWLHELNAADSDSQNLFETLFDRVGRAAEVAAEPRPVELAPGTRLGPWRILEVAGSGGMGTVYRAERADETFSMVVAIKLIRLARRSFEERLRLERELLARLDHRNIARLIDAGATPDDQAYLVMEWVEGGDLDQFVTENQLGVDGLLDLFEQIAEGVAHAHQQRVIHGDLKPSNIRVDDDGRLRLVDFGVARLITEAEVPDQQEFKALTPAFSAPEQLAGEASTTQSDVWALGVVLEWLMTGSVPEQGQAGQSVKLSREIPRKADLQAIIEQACHESPEERYAGVARLLDDLRRYRSCFPVRARARTRRRVVHRFVQRHRLAVGSAAMAVVVLCMALAGTAWQAQQATQERDRAAEETERALLAEQDASRLAEELQAVVDFQEARLSEIDPASMGLQLREDLLDLRRQAMEREAMGQNEIERSMELFAAQLAGINLTDLAQKTLEENILARALEAIDQQISDQPLVRARLLQAIAITARNLGLLERALSPQLEALAIRRTWLGDQHPDTIESIRNTASQYEVQGDRDQALAYHHEALETSREVHGDAHVSTLTALSNLGALHELNGEYERAERYFREVLHGQRELLGDDHPDITRTTSNLASAIAGQDRLEEAKPLYQDVLEWRLKTLGEDHPDTLLAMGNQGWLLTQLDQLDEALSYYKSNLEGHRRILGSNHSRTLVSINNLGHLLNRMDRLDEAALLYREVIERSRILLGDRHPNTLMYISNIGVVYRKKGDLEAAEQFAAEALTSARAVLASDNWHLAVFLSGYGVVLSDQSRFAKAEAALLEAHDLYVQALGSEHRRPANLVPELVDLYERWNEQEPGNDHLASAEAWRERLVEESP